jgi:acyl-coenzyme A thioesterase PaaI-like protein
MANGSASRIARIDKYQDFTSPDNKSGISIDVDVKGNTASSQVTIPDHMAGWRSPDATYAHKGAVATVLETVMAFGGIRMLKCATNAKSLVVEYFTQVPLGAKLQVEAKLMQQRGKNEAILSAVMRDDQGTVLAQATGTYALYTVEELRNLSNNSFAELALGPRLAGRVACRVADLNAFEQSLAQL